MCHSKPNTQFKYPILQIYFSPFMWSFLKEQLTNAVPLIQKHTLIWKMSCLLWWCKIQEYDKMPPSLNHWAAKLVNAFTLSGITTFTCSKLVWSNVLFILQVSFHTLSFMYHDHYTSVNEIKSSVPFVQPLQTFSFYNILQAGKCTIKIPIFDMMATLAIMSVSYSFYQQKIMTPTSAITYERHISW